MTKDKRRSRTKERLKVAMAQLLATKPFDQITTTELVSLAGTSRSGFYTHYADKYDMIDHYQSVLFNTVEYVFDKNKGDLYATLLETFTFLANNDIYAALLSENGSKEIHLFIRSKIRNLVETRILPAEKGGHPVSKLREIYVPTYFSHAIFGLTQSWLYRGKKESPQQITDLLIQLIGDGAGNQ